MAEQKKSPLAWILLSVLFALLLYALNPTGEDFRAWSAARAASGAQAGEEAGSDGVLSAGSPASGAPASGAGPGSGLAAGSRERSDWLLFSSYELGSRRYLGLLGFFVRLK